MLGLVNQDRPRPAVAECLLDGVVVIGGNAAVVRERGHRLRGPVDRIQAAAYSRPAAPSSPPVAA